MMKVTLFHFQLGEFSMARISLVSPELANAEV
jgi:hypothetical protein